MLYHGEHPKRNLELSALMKISYYIYVLTKKHDVCLLFIKNIIEHYHINRQLSLITCTLNSVIV